MPWNDVQVWLTIETGESIKWKIYYCLPGSSTRWFNNWKYVLIFHYSVHQEGQLDVIFYTMELFFWKKNRPTSLKCTAYRSGIVRQSSYLHFLFYAGLCCKFICILWYVNIADDMMNRSLFLRFYEFVRRSKNGRIKGNLTDHKY